MHDLFNCIHLSTLSKSDVSLYKYQKINLLISLISVEEKTHDFVFVTGSSGEEYNAKII